MVVTNLATNHEKKPEAKAQCCAQGLPEGSGQKACLLPIP